MLGFVVAGDFNLKNAAATRLRRAALPDARNGVSHSVAQVRLAGGPQLRFSGHQMGGQERQLKMDKKRRSGGFSNSTAFLRFDDQPRAELIVQRILDELQGSAH